MVRIEDIRKQDFDMLHAWFDDPVISDIGETCKLMKSGNVDDYLLNKKQ